MAHGVQVVEAVVAENVPALQSVHAELLESVENLPASQSSHLEAPSTLENVPVVLRIVRKLNLCHSTKQTLTLVFMNDIREPGAHPSHLSCPTSAYVPALQLMHDSLPLVECFPASQSVQASEPGVPLYLPASHNVHEPWGPVYPAPHSVPGGGGGGDDDVPSSPLSPPPSPPPVPSPSVPVPGGGGGVDDDAPSSPLSPPPDGGGGMHEVSVTELGIGVGVGWGGIELSILHVSLQHSRFTHNQTHHRPKELRTCRDNQYSLRSQYGRCHPRHTAHK